MTSGDPIARTVHGPRSGRPSTPIPPGTAVKFSFTLRQGRKVLATIHDVQHTDDFWVSSGFELLHTQIRFGHRHMHWRGARGGTHLTSTFAMSGGGLTLTRTAKVRAPAARG